MDSKPAVLLGADGVVGAGLVAGLSRRGLTVLPVGRLSEAPPPVGAVVDARPIAQPPQLGEIASLDPDEWELQAEAPLRRAVQVLRDARRRLSTEGGSVVVLLPSMVATGAAGVVPWVAAAEGYRSLAKAVARAWGPAGITVNCVLVPADLIGGPSVDRPGLQPPALGRAVDVESDVAAVVAALATGDLPVTGQTIAVDGGVWMTP